MLASLSHRELTVARWRRVVAASRTSSWTSVAVWIISSTAASVRCAEVDLAAGFGGQQHQDRPQPLAAHQAAITAQFVDVGLLAAEPFAEQMLDLLQGFGNRGIDRVRGDWCGAGGGEAIVATCSW
jgi:hypothetical protein